MPVLFIGHGSPMNAIANNSYTQSLNRVGKSLPTPKAILCVSAHWLSGGTFITVSPNPEIIYDFAGFPEELSQVKYPAPGAPEVAQKIIEKMKSVPVQSDGEQWGLDHGAWSVLRHMYPAANIPVMQLSIDWSRKDDLQYHYKIGEQLQWLRSEGVLILGSGNIVHNLRQVNFAGDAPALEWAQEFDAVVKRILESRDYTKLLTASAFTDAAKLAVPTWDHYLPLLYVLGASKPDDRLSFIYEEIQNASISMRSLQLG